MSNEPLASPQVWLGVLCFIFASCLYSSAFAPGVVNFGLFSILTFSVCAMSCGRFELCFKGWVWSDLLGLLLVGWIVTSGLWSTANWVVDIHASWEYRFFLLVPALAVMCPSFCARYFGLGIMVGGVVSLLASYSLFFGLFELEGAQMSLGNRIFHGFTISIFSAVSFYYWSICEGPRRTAFATLGVLGLGNLLFVEAGRTGYLQAITVLMGAIFMARRSLTVKSCIGYALLFLSLVHLSPSFWPNVEKTLRHFGESSTGVFHETSVGLRLDYYKGALQLIKEKPVLGYGVGGVETELRKAFDSGILNHFTDNVHSEWLNMWLVSGVVGLLLFLAWITALAFDFTRSTNSPHFKTLAVVILAIFVISCTFNSTIKDFGEKHAFLVSLLFLRCLMKTKTEFGDVKS